MKGKGEHMKKYITPIIANYGSCKKIIQGNCGWGRENITLDKTGYRKAKWKKWVALPCAQYETCYAVCQNSTLTCAKANECETVGKKKKVN